MLKFYCVKGATYNPKNTVADIAYYASALLKVSWCFLVYVFIIFYRANCALKFCLTVFVFKKVMYMYCGKWR